MLLQDWCRCRWTTSGIERGKATEFQPRNNVSFGHQWLQRQVRQVGRQCFWFSGPSNQNHCQDYPSEANCKIFSRRLLSSRKRNDLVGSWITGSFDWCCFNRDCPRDENRQHFRTSGKISVEQRCRNERLGGSTFNVQASDPTRLVLLPVRVNVPSGVFPPRKAQWGIDRRGRSRGL